MVTTIKTRRFCDNYSWDITFILQLLFLPWSALMRSQNEYFKRFHLISSLWVLLCIFCLIKVQICMYVPNKWDPEFPSNCGIFSFFIHEICLSNHEFSVLKVFYFEGMFRTLSNGIYFEFRIIGSGGFPNSINYKKAFIFLYTVAGSSLKSTKNDPLKGTYSLFYSQILTVVVVSRRIRQPRVKLL